MEGRGGGVRGIARAEVLANTVAVVTVAGAVMGCAMVCLWARVDAIVCPVGLLCGLALLMPIGLHTGCAAWGMPAAATVLSVPGDCLIRTMGMYRLLVDGAVVIAPWLIGTLIGHEGYRVPTRGTAVLLMLNALLVLWGLRAVRRVSLPKLPQRISSPPTPRITSLPHQP